MVYYCRTVIIITNLRDCQHRIKLTTKLAKGGQKGIRVIYWYYCIDYLNLLRSEYIDLAYVYDIYDI